MSDASLKVSTMCRRYAGGRAALPSVSAVLNALRLRGFKPRFEGASQ